MPGGRPPYKVTPELLQKIETLAAQGLTQEQICGCIGWSVETMCKKKKVFTELSDAIKRGRDKGLAVISNALFDKAKGGDTTAQIFYLKNRAPEEWKDRRDNTISSPDGGPVRITNIELVAPDIESED